MDSLYCDVEVLGLNPVPRNLLEAKKTKKSKMGAICWIILTVAGLMLLGALGAFLTGNVSFFQQLVPWLVAPCLFCFGIYILFELLSVLAGLFDCYALVAWP